MGTYYEPDTILSTIHEVIHIIVPTTRWGCYCYYNTYFADEKTKAQTAQMPQDHMTHSHLWQVWSWVAFVPL